MRAGAGGVIFTSRVGVLKVRLDIKPNERPTQVAKVTLVRIFMLDTPIFFESKGCARAAGKNEMSGVLCGRKPWRTLQNYLEVEQSLCREGRTKKRCE
jgi:hypothetical protein